MVRVLRCFDLLEAHILVARLRQSHEDCSWRRIYCRILTELLQAVPGLAAAAPSFSGTRRLGLNCA